MVIDLDAYNQQVSLLDTQITDLELKTKELSTLKVQRQAIFNFITGVMNEKNRLEDLLGNSITFTSNDPKETLNTPPIEVPPTTVPLENQAGEVPPPPIEGE